jgi:hypothetical protein
LTGVEPFEHSNEPSGSMKYWELYFRLGICTSSCLFKSMPYLIYLT